MIFFTEDLGFTERHTLRQIIGKPENLCASKTVIRKSKILRHLSDRVGSKQHKKHDVESKDFASCFFHLTN